MKKLSVFIIALSSLCFTGLAQDNNVAIVDLDVVAKELGVLDYISKSLEDQKGVLDSQLKEIQGTLQAQLDQVIKDLGDSPTAEETQKARQTNRELELQFQQARAKAQANFRSKRTSLINEFRVQLKPHALAVAKQRNCSVVLNKLMPPVYAFDSGADITQDLIAAARNAGLAK